MRPGSDKPKTTSCTEFVHTGTYSGAWGFANGDERPELCVYISREHWGQGHGTEAAVAGLRWLFENTDTEVVISGAYTFNPASLEVQAKLGFVETGVEDRMSNSQGKALPLVTTRLDRKVFSSLELGLDG